MYLHFKYEFTQKSQMSLNTHTDWYTEYNSFYGNAQNDSLNQIPFIINLPLKNTMKNDSIDNIWYCVYLVCSRYIERWKNSTDNILLKTITLRILGYGNRKTRYVL